MRNSGGNYPLTVGTPQFENFQWVTHYSDKGTPYRLWENPDEMLPIPEDVLDCVFYVYPSKEDAEQGRRSGGSGFLVAVPLPVNKECHALYAVTARHVLDDLKMRHPAIRLNLVSSGFSCLETNRSRWRIHAEDDIAVLPIDLTEDEYKLSPIKLADFVNTNRAQWLALGNDCFMVGRFISYEGKQENIPGVRFGNIAMLPREPMQNKYNHPQQSYLVEQRSLPGYSGSPVFVYLEPQMPRPNVRIVPNQPWNREYHGPWLLGIDWCHIQSHQRVMKKNKAGTIVPVSPERFIESNTGMAGVIPAWRLASFLFDTEEFIVARTKADTQISKDKEKEREHSIAYDSGPEQEPEPFTKKDFESALKKASRRIEPSDSHKK